MSLGRTREKYWQHGKQIPLFTEEDIEHAPTTTSHRPSSKPRNQNVDFAWSRYKYGRCAPFERLVVQLS